MENILQHEWQFWLITVVGDTHQYMIEPIISVNTVESFYQSFTALPDVTEIKFIKNTKISIAFFKGKIKPAWEDPKNAGGGHYTFGVAPDRAGDVWYELLLGAIGETLGQRFKDHDNELNGLIIGPRYDSYYGIEIWTRKNNENEEMKKYIKSLMTNEYGKGVVYLAHHR